MFCSHCVHTILDRSASHQCRYLFARAAVEKERKIVEQIGQWMKINGESIYGTRPWKIFGEGPAQQNTAKLDGPGFNEGKGKAFTHEDIRFATKGDHLYATAMGWPENGKLIIKSLAKNSEHFPKEIQKIEWFPTGS